MNDIDAVTKLERGLDDAERSWEAAFAATADEHTLREANARVLAPLTALMKLMGGVPKERKRDLGQRINALKERIERAFDEKLVAIARAAREAELTGPALDPSLPGRHTH